MASKIEATIRDALAQAAPRDHLTTTGICEKVYGIASDEVEKKHRVAVLRAMRRLVEREPRYVLDHITHSGEVQLFDGTNPEAWLQAYCYSTDWPTILEHDAYELEEGGSCWEKAERHKAQLAGDIERVAELDQARQTRLDASMAAFRDLYEPPPEQLRDQAARLLVRWFARTGETELKIHVEDTGETFLVQRMAGECA